ncbi:MAG: B12-binding domain-containing radical SAM protein [Promethearchaeota archaeon]
MQVLILDCLAVGDNLRRAFSRDFIGGGPKLIAGVIKQLNIDDLYIKIYRAEDFLKRDKNLLKKYDVCLISAMSMDLKSVQYLIQFCRNINPLLFVIVGGPISSDPELLKKINADLCVIGEGERKIVSIFKLISKNSLQINHENLALFKEISGIIFRFNGKIFKTEKDTFLSSEEYQHFSKPVYSIGFLKDYNNYKSARVYVECLRGCSNYFRTKLPLSPAKECNPSCSNCREGPLSNRIECPANIPPGCGFCSTIYSFGAPKSRKLNLILEEITSLIEMGVKRIVLGGPDFLDYKRDELTEHTPLTTPLIPPEPNYEYLNKFINSLQNINAIKEEKVQIFVENIKASLCTEEALKILAKIPHSIFSIGCETGSDIYSILLGRPFTPSTSYTAIKKAVSLGIRVHVYFIHSLPCETFEYLKESIEFIKKLYNLGEYVEKLTIYKYQDFPGAPFYSLSNKEKELQSKNKQLNKYRKKLVSLAISFNQERKRQMVGNNYKVLIAEKTFSSDKNAIGYMLQGGPKIIIENAEPYIGDEVIVEVQQVLSDKLILGKIISHNKDSKKK